MSSESKPPFRDDDLPTEQSPVRFGNYELVELLGEGAMARVFRARQIGPMGFTKEVALKRLRTGAMGRDRREIESLVNEARLGGKLRHPNLVEIYGCDVVDGSFCIAMEYVRGWELDDVLWRLDSASVSLPEAGIIDILRQIASGIGYAHAATDEDGNPLRLVHRDLKPQNIFLDTMGKVKIADFGLAKSTANLYQTTESDVTRGSPLYMSPEQVEGQALDGRSDLFALGSIASELATGIRPFEGQSIPNTLLRVINVDSAEAIQALRKVFPALAPIVSRLLSKRPSNRYPDAFHLLQDLEPLAGDRAMGVHTRALVDALSGTISPGLPAPVRACYDTIAQALAAARTVADRFSGSPAPAMAQPPAVPGPEGQPAPGPGTAAAPQAAAPPAAPPRASAPPATPPAGPPGPGPGTAAAPAAAPSAGIHPRVQEAPRPPRPAAPPPAAQGSRPLTVPAPAPSSPIASLDRLVYEDTVEPLDSRAGLRERPQTRRSLRQAAIRSVLITIFAICVAIYATGLYFEILPAPIEVLSTEQAPPPLAEGAEPLPDVTGQLIHVPRKLAHRDREVELVVRTITSNWRVVCIQRPAGDETWARVPMTDEGRGVHRVRLPAESVARGIMEYYFEATRLTTGERVTSGANDAPYRVRAR